MRHNSSVGGVVVNMYRMAPKTPPARSRRGPADANYLTIGVRTTDPALKTRFRVACAEDGLSGAEMLATLLDLRDDRNRRRRAAMAHPLDTRRNAG
ncbi:ribbon-helix-helix DNA binding protein [Mycobacterium phage Philly]|uniref:Ribbon-helix-helix DNA binding protein n=4 Tax=Pipefishvirus TaxID=1982899 RepID=X2KSG1_9CAUD|nr:gp68 [Mycobacterium phage Phlyer]YP_009011300.1 hypothetical protein CM02_gp069 [Mycobacterium phage Gadjet]YP_009604456.1 hypothetical protein FDH90_gp070 [Mycobacterium phage Athena]AHN83976.1 ribbon-helix-helix DNA binding protein [Mycobacterium phage Audrey]AHN84284.1 ribbon-helix-helix DNA binding protein [Mycobacterium phage Heathcliff]QAY13683.1 ribbon-helix-helix DNA binding protein [Mycobacterium phage RomaT]QFG13831.1 ribbon-helix-helix DNA binding protein [Mycobacterium phage Ph